nr:hypothetical protein [Tanacetum cinerariifolium]
MKMEQYLAHTYYALWEVILNDEHLARFHGIKDAKTLWAGIKTRFGGVSTEDANQKFLRSLPSAWSNISLIMRNKLGIDDLYSNLKVYEADIKGSSGSSLNSQNVAFVSAESTSSTNELNVAYSISFAIGYSSKAQEQINQDDLEEMDFKWQMAMLSMRVKRFYKKTRRKLEFNGKEPIGLTKPRSRDARNAGYIGRDNGKRHAKEGDENALVVQDGLGTYDWSYQVEEEATNFALMAFTLNSSSSSSSISEVQSCSKQCVQSYEQLKTLFDEQREKLSKANIEIIGYDSQFHEKEVLDIRKEEVTKTVFDNHLSHEENSLANDRFKKGEGYHAVLPPLTGNYMPHKPDLSFVRLDDSIYKFKISDTVTSFAKNYKDAPKTSTTSVEKPKEDRSSAPLIQD